MAERIGQPKTSPYAYLDSRALRQRDPISLRSSHQVRRIDTDIPELGSRL
jgi:hypothetical protein